MNTDNTHLLRPPKLALLLIAGAPVLAVVAYTLLFQSGSRLPVEAVSTSYSLDPIIPIEGPAEKKIASVNDMTIGLAARLENAPNDPKGWLLLARSYKHISHLEKAREAYNTAIHYGALDTELEKTLFSVAGSEK